MHGLKDFLVTVMLMKTYVFKVCFSGSKIPYYVIELAENQKLTDLHEAIQDALKWDNDHLYSFFFKPKAKDMQGLRKALDSKYDFVRRIKNAKSEQEREELIAKEMEKDLRHAKIEYSHPYELEEWQKSANVKLSSVGLEPKEKFEYLFDYGDMHNFDVKLIEEGESQQGVKYPRLVMKEGKAPKQYY